MATRSKVIHQTLILVEEPHIQSPGHLEVLKKWYRNLLDKKTPRWIIYLNWRTDVIMKLMELNEPMTCAYCGREHLDPYGKGHGTATFDHIVPKSRGGRTTFSNLAIACGKCNSRKSNREPTPEELANTRNLEQILGPWQSKLSPP